MRQSQGKKVLEILERENSEQNEIFETQANQWIEEFPDVTILFSFFAVHSKNHCKLYCIKLVFELHQKDHVNVFISF